MECTIDAKLDQNNDILTEEYDLNIKIDENDTSNEARSENSEEIQ